MSDHTSSTPLPASGEFFDGRKAAVLKAACGFIGILCLAATLILLFTFSRAEGEAPDLGDLASYSYLFAIIFFFTLTVGGLFWTILHHATNSGWGIVVRRQMENIASLLPWTFLLMVPFLFSQVRDDLWEFEPLHRDLMHRVEPKVPGALEKAKAHWEHETSAWTAKVDGFRKALAAPGATAGEKAQFQVRLGEAEAVLAKLAKQEPTAASVLRDLRHHDNHLLAHKWDMFFHFAQPRLVIYAVVFFLMVYFLRQWSLRTDQVGGEELFLRSRYWSCFFLLPFAVGFTFLVIDFLMALNWEWYSTMWGVYLFAGAALNSMALLILVVTSLREKGYLKVVSVEHYHLMGKLFFAFCVFWAYIAYSQYFLIWYANIAEETRFYLLRNTGGWNILSVVLVVGHFFIPFVVLLWRPIKKNPRLLSAVALWSLAMHFLDLYWIVIPERGPSLTAAASEPQLWLGQGLVLDLVAFVGVGGTLAFIFLHNLSRSSLYPCRDPRLQESLHAVN